jgi:spore germination protein KC
MKMSMIIRMTAIIVMSAVLLTGCWDHVEIDQLAVVAGVAIDKGDADKLIITVETVEVGFGNESAPKPRILTIEGETIFDAVRHMSSVIGKRLYWSHAKVVIVSRDIAEAGILQVLDWFSRDNETRTDINILVSGESTASEILTSSPLADTVVSFEIQKILDSQKRLNHALDIEVWKFANDIEGKGIAATAPLVKLMTVEGKKTPELDGAAAFHGDRLIGFIDGIDTLYLLFVLNKIKGGIMVIKEEGNGTNAEVSLEILHSKTKVTPVIRNGSVEVDIDIKTDTAIDEIGTCVNVLPEDKLMDLGTLAENMLKNRIEEIIKKAQTELDADIFGFGDMLREDDPSAWRVLEPDWHNVFKDIKVNIKAKVRIKNSTMLSKPLEVNH